MGCSPTKPTNESGFKEAQENQSKSTTQNPTEEKCVGSNNEKENNNEQAVNLNQTTNADISDTEFSEVKYNSPAPVYKKPQRYTLLDDVQHLNEVLKKLKVDENELINTIIPRSVEYRQRMRNEFKEIYSQDLVRNIKNKINGIPQHFLTNVLLRPEEFLANVLKKHVENQAYGQLLEALTLWDTPILRRAKQIYFRVNGTSFMDDLTHTLSRDISKGYKDILLSIGNLLRKDESADEDESNILEAADSLSQGADEILDIITRQPFSYTSLSKIFEQYKNRYYLSIMDSIDIEFNNHDGNIQAALTNIVNIAEDHGKYLRHQIRRAIEEKNMDKVIDILLARHAIDIQAIAISYEKQYGSSLQQDISTICSMGDLQLITVFFNYHLDKNI